MNPRELDRAFKSFLDSRQVDVVAAESAVGVRAMLDFYAQERADGFDPSREQDMLLFQWGTFDWGRGEHFELDMTRQVVLPDEVDDDAIWQLHLTYRFAVSPGLSGLGSGDKWCASPSELAGLERYIASSPVTEALAGRLDASVEVLFECAG